MFQTCSGSDPGWELPTVKSSIRNMDCRNHRTDFCTRGVIFVIRHHTCSGIAAGNAGCIDWFDLVNSVFGNPTG